MLVNALNRARQVQEKPLSKPVIIQVIIRHDDTEGGYEQYTGRGKQCQRTLHEELDV